MNFLYNKNFAPRVYMPLEILEMNKKEKYLNHDRRKTRKSYFERKI